MKEYKDYAKITAHFDLAIEEAIKFGGDVGKHAVLLFETMRKELDTVPAADVIEADCLGRVGRLMLPCKGCPRGPIGRLGMAGGKAQDKKAILIKELCCMDTFEDVDGNVWRPVQEEVLQEVIEILRGTAEELIEYAPVRHGR